MASYSSSSFSGPSSPVFAQTVRRQLAGPRSPRAEALYQPRRENGSKVRGGVEDRMGRPGVARQSPGVGVDVSTAGLFPIQTGRASRASKFRARRADDSGSPTSSPPRETRGVTHDPSPLVQAHHAHHESVEYPNRPRLLQVPTTPEPVRPLLPPALLPSPRIIAHRRPPRRPASAAPSPLACPLDNPRVHTPSGSSTPKSPLRPRSVRSTPARRPPTAQSIRQALVPARAPPTLAISMQIHAPAPILSTRPSSPHTNMRSGPSSPRSGTSTTLPPTRPPMPRPPSRSERLLRDTLRRAEEHDRMAALAALPSPSLFGASQPAHGFVPPPAGRRTRRNTSSSLTTDAEDAFGYCDTGVCCSDEEEDGKAWLWRSPSASSSSSGQGFLHYPQQQYSQQQSPTHTQPPLPRHNSDFASHRRGSRASAYDDLSESSARQHLQRAPRSAPTVPRHTSSASRSPPEGAAVTPHEAVLRSRLEGVLSAARARSSERSSERSYGEEWCYEQQQPRRQRVSPLTPPPTPPFNARAAAAACKAMDGYVSFADVQGLGVPADEEEEGEEGEKTSGWRRWLAVPLSPRLRGVSVSESR